VRGHGRIQSIGRFMTAPFSSAENSFPVGSTIVEKYRVERLLGAGGMGAVLEVTHVTLGHRVALKVLHPSAVGVGDAIPRFLREARATAALESEHVVRIFDIGTTPDGMPFLVMERLTGIDLDELLSQIGPLPVGLALECLYQAAQGVREAHAAGIIHRDLKPSNLFLGKRGDGRPLIKVLDFGISKLQEEGQSIRLTETRTIVGSPQYMSPEQVRDARSVSERSDVWALGAILHELLQGKPAFTGDTLPSVCAAIVSDEPAPLARDDVPEEVNQLRLHCLVKDPQARLASADELLATLETLRALYPAPRLDELAVVFPERSARQSAFQLDVNARPAVHSHATVIDTRDTFMNPKETSGVRDVVATSHTLTSGTLGGRTQAEARRRRTVQLGAVALLFAGATIGALFLQKSPEPAAAPAPLPSEPRPVLSLLDISTVPLGALVIESGRVLGRTPTNIELSFADRPTRELELRLDGYHPHLFTVSDQNLGRPIEIQLVALPAEKVIEPETPTSGKTVSAAPVNAPRPATNKKPAPRPEPVAPETKPVAPDIRMSR
jgi:serine/threonine protein kinase